MIFSDYTQLLGIPSWLVVVVLVWSLIWKGLALWRSSRENQLIWFIVFLVVNTIGILEIFYLFLFSKIRIDSVKSDKKIKSKKKKR